MRSPRFNSLLVLALACVLSAGCGASSDRAGREDRSNSPSGAETESDPVEQSASDAARDDQVAPRSEAGWTHVSPGTWQLNDEGAVFVSTDSIVPQFSDPTLKQLQATSRAQLTGSRNLSVLSEEAGTFLGRSPVVRTQWTSDRPQDGGSLMHVKYVFLVGPRMYRVIGVAEADEWMIAGAKVEEFIGRLDFDHPDTEERVVVPGEARGPGKFGKIRRGASAREVQDAISTWALERPGEKPWLPRSVECDEPADAKATSWTCVVDFLAPSSFENDVELTIIARSDGTWSAKR